MVTIEEAILEQAIEVMMMMITPNSRSRKEEKERGKVKGKYGRISREEEGNADYGGMV